MNNAYKQLTQCGALAYMQRVSIVGEKVYADVKLEIIDALHADPQFLSGPLHVLHKDVDRDGIEDDYRDKCEFRSIRGSFGKGSVQIVIKKPTRTLEADVDLYSPYDDVVGAVGHAWEVVRGWFKRSSDV